MKPVRLKFSGLQSYREEQVIDFSELGLLGTFGVFGPTGSGKSTILDAITLALFGKVERAKGGTRGILNQFEDRLSVSFEFSLGEDRYLAERLYAREKHDPDSVRNKGARLVKIADENLVLADKANEMDGKVTQLLGMSFDDFSRAVVLPQGKFDQFLKLTGGDRARMLENILRLERYGENLWKKASNLESLLQQEIQTNQKLIDQLGDASDETIRLAEENLKIHKEKVKEKSVTLEKTQAFLKEMEQLDLVHKEIDALRKEKESLESQQPAMEFDKKRLEKTKKTEPLRGLLEQVEDLMVKEGEEREKVAEQEARFGEIQIKVKVVGERLAVSKTAEKELNRLKEKELPRAALAQDYERQAQVVMEELAGIIQSVGEKSIELEQLTKLGREKGSLLEKTGREVSELTEKRQGFARVLALRPEIEKAAAALVEYENRETQKREAEETLKTREKALLGEEAKLRQFLTENIGDSITGTGKESLTRLLEQVPIVMGGACNRLKETEGYLEQLTIENMAAALADKLAEHEPCPVCGSTSHPKPAAFPEIEAEGTGLAKERAAQAKRELDALTKWEKKVGLAYNTFQTIEDEIALVHRPNQTAKVEALAGAREKLTVQLAALEQVSSEIRGITGLAYPAPDNLRIYKRELDRAEGENKLLDRRIESLREAAKKLEPEITELREKYTRLRAEEVGLKENATARENRVLELRNMVTEITGGLTAAEFQQSVTVKTAAIQEELNEAQRAWDEARNEEQETAKRLEALKAGLSKTNEHLSGLRQNLEKNMAGEGFASLEEVRQSLLDEPARKKIQQRLEDYGKALNHAAKKLTELEAKAGERPLELQLEEARQALENVKREYQETVREEGALEKLLVDLHAKQIQWLQLQKETLELNRRKELASKLVSLLKGRRLVQFLAEEHLRDMAAEASLRLGILTGQRYALELDDGFNFVMRDDYNGGQRRPVNTLSGGETFLTSLSLALALSSKIQLKGQYPLGFFFLDEGFGTLDQEKLEVVVNTLERLHDGQRMVGIITHIPELRNRMPRYLEITPAKMDGTGSMVMVRKN